MYATSCKDKAIRILDGRKPDLASIMENAHEGMKSTKVSFLGTQENF
jgi:coronin-1B/1C/6